MEPLEPDRAGQPAGGGIRRALVTGALALGLLVVGGTAVVLAASPDPSASPAPGTTTQPSTDESTTPQADGTKPDCPDGAGPGRGAGPGGGSDDGSSTAPSQAPNDTQDTTPSTTPDVSDSDV